MSFSDYVYSKFFYLFWCLEAIGRASHAGQWVQTSLWLKAQEQVLNSTIHPFVVFFSFVQLLSLTLCNPMDCSMSGFPVLHCLLEFAQIQVHCQWYHPTISFSVVFSCPKSLPASGSFPMSWLFASGGQNIGASTLASVLPMNIQGWFPLGLTDLISLLSKGLSRVFSSITIQKHQFFGIQSSLWCNLPMHMWLLEEYTFDYKKFLAKWCLCFLTCCLGLS